MTAILAIDQGTTNSKAVLVGSGGRVVGSASATVGIRTPRPGWVEQDPEAIWSSVLTAVHSCLAQAPGITVTGLALSTQRESVVAWHRHGGPVGPVLGWQDRRTAAWCAARTSPETEQLVRGRTGLRIDAMFSAPKIHWLLDQLPGGASADICVGTIDSWLVWRLTGGALHACEAGNASRTLLYDVAGLDWSAELLELFDVPGRVLPEVRPSDAGFGRVRGVPGLTDGLPIVAVLADSHAALFGQGCTEPGTAKATYGTGTSVMAPTAGFRPSASPVPTTLAWLTDRPMYAREGNILSSGATLAWTAELLGLRIAELVELAETVPDSQGVVLVPAFEGLGAPHWDRDARATLSGMTAGTGRAHLARAAVDAVAHQVCDVVAVIESDGEPLAALRADGGATASDLLMQTQADLLDRPVEVADLAEVSALGAAELAWTALGETTGWAAHRGVRRRFAADLDPAERRRRRDLWAEEVGCSRSRHLSRQTLSR